MHMITKTRWLAALLIATTLAACKDKGGDAGEDTETSSGSGTDPTGDPSGDPSGSPTSAPTSTSASSTTMGSTSEPTTSTTMSSTDPTDDTTEPDSTGDPDTGPVGDAIYEEDFAGNDGDPWPAPWEIAGEGIIDAELDGGRGRMSGVTMHTSRMILPGFDELDAEMYVTVTFDDPAAQGFGFYCRQNGGALTDTDPPGEGYAVFFEGAYDRDLARDQWRRGAAQHDAGSGSWRVVRRYALSHPFPVPTGRRRHDRAREGVARRRGRARAVARDHRRQYAAIAESEWQLRR
jgi:hypothetical protein